FGMGTGAATPPEPPGRQSARFALSWGKPNEKLAEVFTSLVLNTSFALIRIIPAAGRAEPPVVRRAVRSAFGA
ncbi:hypothetical protein, partial [Ensifer sp. Root31]|uniref:hypothetical protein n=1 Tax=Ensifer sp. Root31 TaxID=1736512 RepID=UPI001AECB132